MNAILSDTFTGPAGTLITAAPPDIGQPFSAITGNFKLTGGGFCTPTANGIECVAVSDAGNPNATVSLDVVLNAGDSYQEGGLVFRYVDANNYWLLRVIKQSNQLQLYEKKAGTYTLKTALNLTLVFGTVYTPGVVLNGSGIQVTLNGANQFSVVSTDFMAATKYGLRAYSSGSTLFDNLTVTPLSTPAPQISFTANPLIAQTGQQCTLNWFVTNATSVSIDQGLGSVALSGSASVTVNQTTTYTLTAVGDGGQSSATVTILTLGLTVPTDHSVSRLARKRIAAMQAWRARNPSYVPPSDNSAASVFAQIACVLADNGGPQAQVLVNNVVSWIDNTMLNPDGSPRSAQDDNWRWRYTLGYDLDVAWPFMTPAQRSQVATLWQTYQNAAVQQSWPRNAFNNYDVGYGRNSLQLGIALYTEYPAFAASCLQDFLISRWPLDIPFISLTGPDAGGTDEESDQYGRYAAYLVRPVLFCYDLGRDLTQESTWFHDFVHWLLHLTTKMATYTNQPAVSPFFQTWSWGETGDTDAYPGYPDARPWWCELMWLASQLWPTQPEGQWARHWLTKTNAFGNLPVDLQAMDVPCPEADWSQTLAPTYKLPGVPWKYLKKDWTDASFELALKLDAKVNVWGHDDYAAGGFYVRRGGHILLGKLSGYSTVWTDPSGTIQVGSQSTSCGNTLVFGPENKGTAIAYMAGPMVELEDVDTPAYAVNSVDLSGRYQEDAVDAAARPEYDNPYCNLYRTRFLTLPKLETVIVHRYVKANAANGLTAAQVQKTQLLYTLSQPTINQAGTGILITEGDQRCVITVLTPGCVILPPVLMSVPGKGVTWQKWLTRIQHTGTAEVDLIFLVQSLGATDPMLTLTSLAFANGVYTFAIHYESDDVAVTIPQGANWQQTPAPVALSALYLAWQAALSAAMAGGSGQALVAANQAIAAFISTSPAGCTSKYAAAYSAFQTALAAALAVT